MARKYTAQERKDFLKKMRDMALELRKMCHRKDCDSPYDCPQECCAYGNRKKLDLHTAIAWNAALIIEECARHTSSRIAVMRKAKEKLRVLYDVLNMHCDQYAVIQDTIYEVLDELHWATTRK